MKLSLLFVDTENESWLHGDAFTLARLFGGFDLDAKKHPSEADRLNAIRMRKKFVLAHDATASSVRLTGPQVDLLKRVLEDPSVHLMENALAQGRSIPVRDEILSDIRIAAGIANITRTLAGKPGIYEDEEDDEDEEDEEDDEDEGTGIQADTVGGSEAAEGAG